MKKITVMFLAFIFAAGICFASDPVEGYWLSIDEKTNKITAGWIIYQENGKLYGKVVSSAIDPPGTIASGTRERYPGFPIAGKVNEMPMAGTPWIFGLTRIKPGEWSGGSVINPEDGRMYNCKIIFRAADGRRFLVDTLEMRAEIGLRLGRSQFWRKTERATASSLWPR